MRNMLRLLLGLHICAALVYGAAKHKTKHLPSYISACHGHDRNFSKCVLQHGREAIPRILRGDPAFKLRTFLPYHLEQADLTPNNQLSLVLKDIDLYGLDSVELLDANFDLERKRLSVDLYAKRLVIQAKYNVSGQILVLPVRGNGPLKLEFGDGNFKYWLHYDLVSKPDGKLYIGNIKPNVEFKIDKAHYQFDNLFNGNKELGENVNKVLNENSKEVLTEFGAVIKEVINVVATQLIQAYATSVPYDELFLL